MSAHVIFHLVAFFLAFFTLIAKSEHCVVQDFTVHQINGSFAAEIVGLDLEHVTDAQFGLVEHYLSLYPVLVFRNQEKLSIEGQRSFSRRFGPLQTHVEATSHMDGYSDVNLISNLKREDGQPTGLYGQHVESYHSDLSYTELPSKVTLLKSLVLPSEGGDTFFSSSVLAYSGLSDEWKARIDNLTATYSYLKYRGDVLESIHDPEAISALQRGAIHPLVSMHPVTGQLNLMANNAHTLQVHDMGVGMDIRTEDILAYLIAHIQNEEYVYVHRWQPFDLLIWDNRAVQHRASPAPLSPRQLVRTTTLQDTQPARRLERLLPQPPYPCSEMEL